MVGNLILYIDYCRELLLKVFLCVIFAEHFLLTLFQNHYADAQVSANDPQASFEIR